jgi:hypothetical protein
MFDEYPVKYGGSQLPFCLPGKLTNEFTIKAAKGGLL